MAMKIKRKTERLDLRIDRGTYLALKRAARAEKRTLSDYIRISLVEAVGKKPGG